MYTCPFEHTPKSIQCQACAELDSVLSTGFSRGHYFLSVISNVSEKSKELVKGNNPEITSLRL